MAQNIVFRVVADTQPAVDGMNKLDSATKNAKKDVNQLDQALGKIGAMVAGAFALGSVIQFGKEVYAVTNEVNSLNIRMSQLQGTADATDRAMGMLVELSKRLGVNMNELTGNYVQFVSAAKASGIEVSKSEKIFINMTTALRGTGASADATKRAMTALTQMMGKGCHAPGTLIKMYDGTIKAVEDIKVGDVLVSPCGQPRIVEITTNGHEEMFEIQTEIGISFVVNRSHKMRVYIDGEKQTIKLGEFIQSATFGKICHESGAVNFKIKSVGEGEFYGFRISDDHLYLDANGFEHHNTIMSEELKGQLGEAMPQAIGWMAKSLGVGTKQLFKMMEQGQLTSESLLGFSEVAVKSVGGSVDAMSKTMEANVARLSNSWQAYMASLGQRFYGAGGGAEVLSNMLDWWMRINASQDQYIKMERQRLLGDSKQQEQVSKEIEFLREKKLSEDEIIKNLQAERDMNFELVKTGKNRYGVEQNLSNELKINILSLVNAYDQQIKLIKDGLEAKKADVPLTQAQIKAQEKLRKEQEKLQELRAKEEGIQPGAGQNVPELSKQAFLEQFFKWQDNAYERNLKKRLSDIDELEEASNYFHSDQMKLFNGELRALDMKHRLGKIKEEEYLKELLKLHKKYGVDVADVEDKITLTDFDKKQTRKAYAYQMAGETASAVTSTILSYKQKEIDGEKEMVENQRQQGLISQEQYDQQIRAIKRKEAIADRIAAIAQIAINTAIAITNPTNAASALTLTPLYLANAAIQTGIVLAQPLPYNKGTKRVPMMRGAMRGRDSVHAILTPDERVVPADINTQPGYSALLDLAQDKKISDKEAGFLADLATSGMRRTNTQQSIDPDTIGRAIAKYIPHTNVAINERGIAVITERSQTEIRRLRRRIS
jgi:hypothetical protein